MADFSGFDGDEIDFGEDIDFGNDLNNDIDFGSAFNDNGSNFEDDFSIGNNSLDGDNYDEDSELDNINRIENGQINGASNKKVLIVVICFGIALILGSLLINTKIKQYKAYRENKVNQQIHDNNQANKKPNAVNGNNNTNKNNQNSSTMNNSNVAGNNSNVDKNTVNLNTSNGNSEIDIVKNPMNWVPFSVEYYGEPSDYIEAVFKVSSINGYLASNNSNELGLVKYTVSGNIEGIEGLYDVDISYDIANKLNVGTEFKIWVRLIDLGNKKIICDISTKGPNM